MPLFTIQSTKYQYSTDTHTQLVPTILDSTSVAELLQFLSSMTGASLSLVISLGVRVSILSVQQGQLSHFKTTVLTKSRPHQEACRAVPIHVTSLSGPEALESFLHTFHDFMRRCYPPLEMDVFHVLGYGHICSSP